MEKLRVPVTMMTQHPDACRYVPIQEEPSEAIQALTPSALGGLGIEEVMVDFEGKLTPYQQTSQIVLGLLSKGIIPGQDVFVTPRIPSGIEEGVFRQLMALMSVVESNYHTFKEAGIYGVKEVILPMVSSSSELLSVRERIIDVIDLAHKEFGMSKDPALVALIPLIETMPQILEIKNLLQDYLQGCQKRGIITQRIRFMIGRSDLALSYGLVPAVLANKVAISSSYKLQATRKIEVLPILGGGTLPFRGHFTLENIKNTLKEYRGVRTLTLQSAMRYDHGKEKAQKLARLLQQKLPKTSPLIFDKNLEELLINLCGIFTKHYLSSFFSLAKVVKKISDFIPLGRDRLARKSEVGYARDWPRPGELAKKVSDKELAKELVALKREEKGELPRAISYTAALYSIGLPPEIIGTGRGLEETAQRYGKRELETLLKTYPSLKEDLQFACRFVDLNNAREFLPATVIAEAEADLKFIWKYLKVNPVRKDGALKPTLSNGVKMGKEIREDRLYATILETMKPMLKEISSGQEEIVADEALEKNLIKEWVLKLGRLRGALG